MLRRFFSCLLVFALLSTLVPCFPASAAEILPTASTDYFCDITKTTHLTSTESAVYDRYEALLSNDTNNTRSITATKDKLLAYCTLSSSYYVGDTPISLFTSDTISGLLYDCATVTDISIINDYLYISYITNENAEITLSYHQNGLHDKIIYFPDTDTAIIDDGYSVTKVESFRTGCSYEVPEEIMHEAYAMSLAAQPAIESTLVNPDNSAGILPSINDVSPLATGFSNEASMLADLRSSFPIQNGTILLADSLYSSYLGDSFSVTVRQTQNGYTKKSADYRNFAVSTALSVIGTFLGVPVSVASAIVTSLGIVISAANTISQAATLYRSAIYRFYAARDGYVYDKITQNAYVHVVYNSSYGEFTGGYASDGSFTWVISSYPSAYDQSATAIANEALRLYGLEVAANGYNSRYYPD